MKVYLVKAPEEAAGEEPYRIIKVGPEQEPSFLRQYAGRILAEGESVQEVLIKFNELQNKSRR